VDHVADGLVTIHALTGHVQVKTPEGERELQAGTLLVLSPGVVHDLHATVASQVLLTVTLESTR
jgi:quercetin dioxygenase-like cupin family protein